MAKSIIDIDVNAQSFKDFQALFSKYQDQLAKMPEAWKNVDASVKSVTDSFAKHVDGGTADAFAEGAAAAQAMADAMASADASTKSTTRGMVDLAKHSKSVASAIFGATASLAKWGALGAGAGLVGTGGSLFGLDRLGDTVSDRRRAASGLGINTGELQAFNSVLGPRLMDASLIQSVSDLRADPQNSWKLGPLAGAQRGEDNAQLSVDELKRARQLWKQLGPGGQNTSMMQAYGLDGMMQLNDWRRIGNTSDAEFNADINQFQTTAKALNVPDPTLKTWQDFVVQLTNAGNEIENVFVVGLKPIVGPLTNLSKAFTDDFKALLKNPALGKGIDDLASWIESFSKYLGSTDFKADMKAFAGDISAVASGLENALRWLLKIPSAGGPPGPGSMGSVALGAHQGAVLYPRSSYPNMGDAYFHGGSPFLPVTFKDVLHGQNPFIPVRIPGVSHGYDFRKIAKFYGLPPELFVNAARAESGFDPNAVSSAGAQGMFQFMPGTQLAYGVTDPFDPTQEAQAYGAKMNDLLTEYHGSLSKAIAAYNWGDGNLNKDIAAHPKDWMNYVPKDTRGYVKAVSHGITVNVNNQTGANVAVIANTGGHR